MNLDDPKLTASALNELDDPERSTIAREVAKSPDAQRIVDETRELAQMLKAEYAAERVEQSVTPANLIGIRDDPWFWSIARPLAIAAVIAICGLVASVIVFSFRRETSQLSQVAPRPTEVEGEIITSDDMKSSADSDRKSGDADNPFLNVATNPISTFSYNVGRASYLNISQAIRDGSLPARDSVRIEEMINYFDYDYAEPAGDKLFAIHLDAANCPWQPIHQLVRIGVKGGEGASARDVKIDVEFNPARVASYRLIGYERRMLRKEDFNNDKVDAGEIGAGRTVTALYEVVAVGANPAASVPPVDPLKYSTNERSTSSSGEMLTVKLRHKKPDGDKRELIERAITDNGTGFEKASADFKFAAAVAEFGMILRDSEHKGNGTLGAVLEWAREGKGADANGYRAGFIELVRKAQSLRKG